jgi:2-keto-4-pentenoate hydratase/2-oxohepta-3-ene-1,7-dioic acid hydratase in catechol pathway
MVIPPPLLAPFAATNARLPPPNTTPKPLPAGENPGHIDGVGKQRSNTAYMLFKVDELIADISQGITLEPGDIIATGTPAGVGAGRTPQEWVWPGDVIECEVVGIGKLRQPVVAV